MISSRIKSSSKNFIEFFVKTTYSKLLKIHILFENLFFIKPISRYFQNFWIPSFANYIRLLIRFYNSVSRIWFYVDRSDFLYIANKNNFSVVNRQGKLFSTVYEPAFETFTKLLNHQFLLKFQDISVISVKLNSWMILTQYFDVNNDRYFLKRVDILNLLSVYVYTVKLTQLKHFPVKRACSKETFCNILEWLSF